MERRDDDGREIAPGTGAGLGPEPEPGDVAGGTGSVERERSEPGHTDDERADAGPEPGAGGASGPTATE